MCCYFEHENNKYTKRRTVSIHVVLFLFNESIDSKPYVQLKTNVLGLLIMLN